MYMKSFVGHLKLIQCYTSVISQLTRIWTDVVLGELDLPCALKYIENVLAWASYVIICFIVPDIQHSTETHGNFCALH